MYAPLRAAVRTATDLSPSFRRIVFTGPDLDALEAESPVYDQRIKLILPPASGRLPVLDSPEWYRSWLALPEEERGSMRTYSIRSVTRGGDGTRLAVDFALHEGACGPAGDWAAAASEGEELLIVAPCDGPASGGFEFDPGGAREIVLLGDETAAPAIARILEDLAAQDTPVTGRAFIEVPTGADRLTIDGPASAEVRWLPRDGAARGDLLAAALGWHIAEQEEHSAESEESSDLIWETPAYSASGEAITPRATTSGTYYWIAGESSIVTGLRRHLVREVGIDRSQVAFMGYWREGVAMRG